MSFFAISKSELTENNMAYSHSHKYYELYFQTDGVRMYFCNNKYYTIQPNTLIVTRPNVLHKFENGPFERYLISVDESLFSTPQLDFLNMLERSPIIPINENDVNDIKTTLNDLIKLEQSLMKNKSMVIALKLGFLLHQFFFAQKNIVKPLVNFKNDSVGYSVAPTIAKIMEFIQKNFAEDFSLNDLSKKYQLSKTWLCKCFFNATNMTIFEYKTMLQINAAKKLLDSSNLNIETISKKIGVSSPRYFCMLFKKHTGISPLQWRKQFRPITSTILNKKRKNSAIK
ncbi:MAG: AraC family transcriptional regulator [Clostridiales bacterium]|nr:AraC family transcriptional regulator [Clostridiales bacterium]